MRTVDDLAVAGQTVLVRSDLNVPLDSSGGGTPTITDDMRIQASLPTIRDLAGRGARVVVMAHLGRPKGEVKPGLSLRPVAARLSELLGQPVGFPDDAGDGIAGAAAKSAVDGTPLGGVVLLENLRFEAAETSKDDAERGAFADRLAALAGAGGSYVGDGFGAVHRKHASVYDLPQRLPHAAGGLVLAEVTVLRRLTDDVERPYVVVLGGAKVSDKLGVIANLLDKVDRLLVGGGMAYTFLAAQGYEVGNSLLEGDQLDTVRGFIAEADKRGVELVLPVDIVAATQFSPDAEHAVVPASTIPADREGLDIGPKTRELFAAKLADARTVFWNGPMGVFEFDAFAHGTKALATALRGVDGLTVVGGGDSAAAIRKLGFHESDFGHVSTGGGASLEYLEGKTLPGLQALED
ncbi:MAG: phosphoglycerate kinase [Actinomycetota bacterium]|nr:phosphoglycerate kinase [Actinomycetota bacterium]